MADEITPFLKLRVPRGIDSDSRFNLFRIDLLGRSTSLSTTGDLTVRSANNIEILPEAATLAGDGDGGEIRFGNSSHSIDNLQVYSDLTTFHGLTSQASVRLSNSTFHLTLQAPTLAEDVTISLPVDGTGGQFLTTDGNGNWSFATVSGSSFKTNWPAASGSSLAVNHNLNSLDVGVTVYDSSSGDDVHVDVVRTTVDDVSLIAAQAPPAGGYRVIITVL